MPFEAVFELKNRLDEGLPKKDWLDKHLFKYIALELSPWGQHREPNQNEIVCAKTFLSFILPYCELNFDSQDAAVKYAPSLQVLGGQYVGHQSVSKDKLHKLLDFLDDKSCVNGHAEQAKYTQVGEFPFYRPYEGKNRVHLYRSAKRPIKALVRKTKYPEAKDLKLLTVKPYSDCFALEYTGKERVSVLSKHQIIHLSDRRIASLITFNESIEVLEDYGVTWGKPIYSVSAFLKKRICRIKSAHAFYRR